MKFFCNVIIAPIFLLMIADPLFAQAEEAVTSPPIAKVEVDTVNMHGYILNDNYSWMKDKERNKEETLDYVKAENEYTDKMMEHTEELQNKLFEEIKGRIKQTDLNLPVKIDNYYYYSRKEEDKQYSIYCRKKDSLDGEEEITLDVNKLAEGFEFYQLGSIEYSPDHRYLAYSADTSGAEKYTLYFKDLETGQNLSDKIYPSVQVKWANDNKTVFYLRNEDPDKESSTLIYRHSLGTKQDEDVLIYTEENLAFGAGIGKSKSEEYLMLYAGDGSTNEVRYLKADDPYGKFKLIKPREKEINYYPAHHGDKFYIQTNIDGAKNNKIMVTSVDDPSNENWQEFIAHRDSVYISDFEVFKNYMTITERKNGLDYLRIINLNTKEEHYVEFPEPIYQFYAASNPVFDVDEYRFYYSSLVSPWSIFDYNVNTREMTLKKQYEVLGGHDSSLYKSERIWVEARDGEKVPVSLVYKKDLFKKDGSNPLYMYAYGSYGINSDPTFSSTRLTLLNRGFVYAIAHIRGGKEMGEFWHEQGKILTKKNTFTDFIDCADHLIAEKYTSNDKLVINGGSAGGMLMGVVSNWRPDLFKVVIANVPAVDELNHMLDSSIPGVEYHYNEWGNPNIKEEFEYFLSWDAYYNLRYQDYPNILVTTGVHDPRVPYWEPVKWVAKLRTMKTDDNILLLKTKMAGHGGASARDERYKETAFEYTFIFDILGLGY